MNHVESGPATTGCILEPFTWSLYFRSHAPPNCFLELMYIQSVGMEKGQEEFRLSTGVTMNLLPFMGILTILYECLW